MTPGDAEGRPAEATLGTDQDSRPAPELTATVVRVQTARDAARLYRVLAEADPVVLGVALARLGDRPADDAHVVAARLALELTVPPSTDDYLCGGRWHRETELLPSELVRRRFPPNGSRSEWVEFGPSGTPKAAA